MDVACCEESNAPLLRDSHTMRTGIAFVVSEAQCCQLSAYVVAPQIAQMHVWHSQ